MQGFLWLSGLMITLFSSMILAADCRWSSIGEIREIVRIENSSKVYVIRAACPPNKRVEAYNYQSLYEGDRIYIADETKVIVSKAKGKQKIFTKDTNDELLQGSLPQVLTWPRIPFPLPDGARKHIPVFNMVRSPTRRISLENDPLLPSGTQYLPNGYKQAALLWRGGPAKITLSTPTERTEFNTRNRAFSTIPIPQNQTDIRIHLPGQKINWHIQNSEKIPIPESIHGSSPASLSDRLIRAIWILKDGPDEWRLFALSELEALSHTGSFAAEKLWHAAISGELTDVLQTND